MGRFRFFRSLSGASGNKKEKTKTPEEPLIDDPLKGHAKYTRVMDINSGTFGFVVKAAEKESGSHVAIKFLPRGRKIGSNVEREILNHKALRHPHVVQFKEVFFTDKYLAIAMEYADQGDLFHYVRANGRLREDVARWIFQQLIFGLDYCHRKGVANRDIKLENILLQSGSRRPLVKLCDFGYSKHEDLDSIATSRVGTPDYMSPEILRSRGGAYDAKLADLWSCGVVLYVMVVGKYPFSHKEDAEFRVEEQHRLVLNRILELKYTLPAFLSASCADLVRRLLDPNPDTRITIPDIIQHPWHKVGLPPSASKMNDVYLQVTPENSQSDEDIKSIVSAATNRLDMDEELIIRAMEEDPISFSGSRSIE